MPDDAIERQLSQAVTLHRQGKFAEAARLYIEILHQEPRHFAALHLLGVAAFQQGRLAEAIEGIRAALEIQPDNADALTNLGLALATASRFEEALAHYDKALAIRPDLAQALHNRGNALQSLGRLAEALDSYDRSLALQPNNPDALYSRGIALRSLGRLEDALASYDRALALRPHYAETLNNRGNVLKDLRRLEEALASYDAALTLRPDYAEALNNRGSLLHSLMRSDEALACYEKALAIRPTYADAAYNFGVALLGLDRLEEAAAQYRRALDLDPARPDAHIDLGLILVQQEKRIEAIGEAEIAAQFKGSPLFPHYRYGVLLARCNLQDAARVSFDEYLRRDPQDRLGARMCLATLGFEPLPERTPSGLLNDIYLRRAGTWDRGASSYAGARLVATCLERRSQGATQLAIIDAGCGTGLVGPLVRGQAARLEGVDASAAMLEQARGKGVYDRLHHGDLVAFLVQHPNTWDAVTCAATLIHFGNLTPVFEAVAAALRDQGLFVFTLFPNEDDPDGIAVAAFGGLAEGGCFAHGRRYVTRVAEASGFAVENLATEIHEYSGGKPRDGLVVALRLRGRGP